MKTIKLNRPKFGRLPPTVERTIRDGAYGAAMIVLLMLVHTLLKPTPVTPQAVHTPSRPVIVIATARPLPTPTVAPTQTPVVVVREVYVEAPTPEPEVIYVVISDMSENSANAEQPTSAPASLAIQDRAQWSVAAATARAGR